MTPTSGTKGEQVNGLREGQKWAEKHNTEVNGDTDVTVGTKGVSDPQITDPKSDFKTK